jgi:dipeptidyl aminopeptidase/acylaminoacyl peptidase
MKLLFRPACVFAFAAALSSTTFSALAQRDNGRSHAPTAAAVSPDGTTVAWTVRAAEGSTLHLTDLANPDPAKERIITPSGETNCSNTMPVWSPDGTTLAFTSSCTSKDQKPGQEQIFLWSKADGSVKQLTHVTGIFHQAAWSPDGKSIAFLFVENATRSAGALDAMKPWAGVIGEDGVEVQRVYSVDLADGKGRFLTPLTLHVYEFAYSPNGNEIAYVGADAPGENNWWVASIWAASARLGSNDVPQQPRLILAPTKIAGPLHNLQIAVPRWSPDGKRIAFIGGLMSDQGSTGGDVWVVNADGKGAPTDITPGIDGTPVYEAWINDNRIGFVEDRRGHIVLPDYDVAKRALIPHSDIDLGEVSISGGPIKDAVSFSDMGGAFALVKQSLTAPPEVWAGPLDKLKQLTHLNDNLKPTTRTEAVDWENEGFHVQGWLTFPADYDEHKKYPIIVQVHGGPSSSIGAQFDMGTMWAKAGYFEFQPNPRGSFGQGEKFTQANIKDFGYGDLRDILKGLDTVEAKYPIDKNREGLTGWSYGGFMTMFAVTQTGRFRAAVAGAGISNWQSYYGQNSIDQWMIPFFGKSVYDDPAVYAKSSAINFIKKVKTPTLIIVGDRDGECPAPQSFEMWHALRDLGTKTQLVIYPNEGHGFRNPEHIKDRNEREVKWFNENMPAE